jgi:hypothetical protein
MSNLQSSFERYIKYVPFLRLNSFFVTNHVKLNYFATNTSNPDQFDDLKDSSTLAYSNMFLIVIAIYKN